LFHFQLAVAAHVSELTVLVDKEIDPICLKNVFGQGTIAVKLFSQVIDRCSDSIQANSVFAANRTQDMRFTRAVKKSDELFASGIRMTDRNCLTPDVVG